MSVPGIAGLGGHVGDIGLREANPGDATALGALHVQCWHEAYRGLLPDRLLDGMSAAARSAMWSTILSDETAQHRTAVFVAVSSGELVGFGACAGQRDAALKAQGFFGEFGSIYVLGSHQRAGVGRSLMSLMARHMSSKGWNAAALWVLRDNIAARTFYECLGGAIIGERCDDDWGTPLPEVAYGWSNLSPLYCSQGPGLGS